MGNGTKFINEILNTIPELPSGYSDLSESYKKKCIYYVRRLKKAIPHVIEQPFESFTELEKFVIEADKNGFSQFMLSDFTKRGITFKNHTLRLQGMKKYLTPQEVANGIMHFRIDLTKEDKTTYVEELGKLISALNLSGITTVDQLALVLSESDRESLKDLKQYFEHSNRYIEFLKLVSLLALKNTKCEEGDISQLKDDFDVEPELALPGLYPLLNEALSLSIKELKYL